MHIPFNKVYLTNKEIKYMQQSLNKETVSFTDIVKELFINKFDISNIFMTTSGTAALEMAAHLIDLKQDDEVIMPSFTFPSTANSIMLKGAKPIFTDISFDTLNIDHNKLEKYITKKTKAILPVHYGGIACEMDSIMSIAHQYGLYVIEDSAQGVNSKYKDKYLGTIGDFGCYSFHNTKNYICGEGGAIIINSKEELIKQKSKLIYCNGTNRIDFLQGKVDKYSWVDIGSSFAPSEILMAILLAQIEEMDIITAKRKAIHDFYYNNLENFIDSDKILSITNIPKNCQANYHLFYVIFGSEEIRDIVKNKLHQKDIFAYTHFEPLHNSLMGSKLGYNQNDLPITTMVGKQLLRLPLYTDMTLEESDYVIKNLVQIIKEL